MHRSTDEGRLMNTLWPSDLNWDTRVVYIQRHQRWWWNAWLASTATELYGFADSQREATRVMHQAIKDAETTPSPDRPQGSTR